MEYVDKLLSPVIVPIEENQISHFSNNYGEVSFLIVSEDEDSDFFKCLKQIAEDYLPHLYFGHLKKSSYKTKTGLTINSPSVIVIYY